MANDVEEEVGERVPDLCIRSQRPDDVNTQELEVDEGMQAERATSMDLSATKLCRRGGRADIEIEDTEAG